ncbi:MAG: hypothetical protein LBC52_07400 [Treponema sp.]|jgi:hypothetical protein|nr:hypothetical protein [Treponema sp.]
MTKNGTGDLAVMSIEIYEFLAGKQELYALIEKGLTQVKDGRVKSMFISKSSMGVMVSIVEKRGSNPP